MQLLRSVAMLALSATMMAAADSLIEPGLRLAVIDTPHIHALVPADQAASLQAQIQRADQWYVRLARDADYIISKPLNLLVTDSVDTHNGYSFVTPYPLIHIQLAPALPQSGIFTGEEPFERTFIHEVTHHISNDRSYGGRRILESVFGRILPSDILSALTAYLSTPAHQTMPSFWHEGLAQWAETHYADPASPWAGRGRDSLTHMVWRLDTAAGAVPPPGNWHYSYHRWPYGSEAYLYGIAYLRYLYGTYGQRLSPFAIAEHQAHEWAFEFDNSPLEILGKTHGELIADARAALEQEQQRNLAIIRSQPVTVTKRLTPDDWRIGTPCWSPDGRLFAALDSPTDQPRFGYVDATGKMELTGDHAFAMGAVRSLPDGTMVYHEIPEANDTYTHSQIYIRHASGLEGVLIGQRWIQPDLRLHPDQLKAPALPFTLHEIAVTKLAPSGHTLLCIYNTRPWVYWTSETKLQKRIDSLPEKLREIPTQGRPWSPTFRPHSDDLTWVETDHLGSRLILAPLADPTKRTVLATIHGRIMEPSWSADGKFIFICADLSGVPNAYRIDVDKPGELVPVTNTVGGIIACVPSFDGKELAVIDHDHHGPYLARIANDPAAWPKSVPTLLLSWPDDQLRLANESATSPVGEAARYDVRRATSSSPTVPTPNPDKPEDVGPRTSHLAPNSNSPAPDSNAPVPVTTTPYHGLPEIRPLFWTPTTLPVPEGGYGILGVAMDPAQTHQMIASLGVGTYDHSPVGMLGWIYSGWPIDVAVLGWQAERTYLEQLVLANSQIQDFSESRATGEARVGYGLTGRVRRWQTWLAAGVTDTREAAQSAARHDGVAVLNNPAPFMDHEQYVEATVAYSGTTLFPTSYAHEDGPTVALSARHSGYGGELNANRFQATGGYVLSVIPSWGQQVVVGGSSGWSQGDQTLQGQFHTGGNPAQGLPRGYPAFMSTGAYLLGGTVAWRTPLWQPFHGHGTTPFVSRQAVLEVFYEGAKASTDYINGNGFWYRSTGAELRWSFSFWEQLLNPGFGIAKQVDGYRNTSGYFTLDWRW